MPSQRAWKYYGGRGITMCAAWVSNYAAFKTYVLENLGPCPTGYTLDRIRNDGHYEPGNVRWATWSEQRLNQRGRSYWTLDGKRITVKEMAAYLALSHPTMKKILRGKQSK